MENCELPWVIVSGREDLFDLCLKKRQNYLKLFLNESASPWMCSRFLLRISDLIFRRNSRNLSHSSGQLVFFAFFRSVSFFRISCMRSLNKNGGDYLDLAVNFGMNM